MLLYISYAESDVYHWPILHLIYTRFFKNKNMIFLFKVLVTFLIQNPKLLMQYFMLIFSL